MQVTFKRLFGRVDRSMYEALEKKLHTIPYGSCLFLIFKSDGGDLEWARKMCSLLHRVSKEKNITTVGFGYGNVYSAALRIFLSCHHRLGLPSAKYWIHLPRDTSFEPNDRDVLLVADDEINFFSSMTGASKDVMKQLFLQGIRLNAAQAFALGVTTLLDHKRPMKPRLATA